MLLTTVYKLLFKIEDDYDFLMSWKRSSVRTIKSKDITAFALLPYKDTQIRKIVKKIKYKGNSRLTKIAGKMMAEEINRLSLKFDLLIPVPISVRRRKQRGYNQAEMLAESIAMILDSKNSIEKNVIIKVKDAPSQTSLKRKERYQNLKGAFKVVDPRIVYKKDILIVDDVITTGSTILEMSNVLKESGVGKLQAIALAG